MDLQQFYKMVEENSYNSEDVKHLIQYCEWLEQEHGRLSNDIQLMDRNFRKWTGSSAYGIK